MKSTKIKKILATALATAMCASFSLVAFADDWAGKVVEGYGLLTGLCYASKSDDGMINVTTVTGIETNPDDAYLKVKVESMNSAGETLDRDQEQSVDGETYLDYTFCLYDDSASVAYVAHNVQGGYKYPAQVIYTSTRDFW